MSSRRYSIFAAFSLVLAASWSAVLAYVDRAVAFVFSILARPAITRPAFGRVATAGGPALAYDAPPAHFLRHEAGTPQRGAHRNI